MKRLGISVFSGLEQTADENVEYMKRARSLGYDKIFTSLHIPEADHRSFLKDCRKVLDEAVNLGFEITADVSPHTWTVPGLKAKDLKTWGVRVLRIDFGYSPQEIKDLTDGCGLGIELNASSTTEAGLTEFLSAGLDLQRVSAGHNYYPRPETGLSFELFARRCEPFRRRGLPVSAFIPGKSHPRGPVFSGLPTVEAHRSMSSLQAVRQFWSSGLVDSIIFGDPMVSERELSAVASLPREISDPLPLRIETDGLTEAEGSVLWSAKHRNRSDAAGFVVRSQESRETCRMTIAPRHLPRKRTRGDITIDNIRFGRYEGELQIVLTELPLDERVNVVGKIIDDDLCLLDCLFPGREFSFREA